jgi:glycosyltransferase involved in cell wall biosynthesis
MEAVLLQIIRSRDIQIIHISNSELGYQAVPAVKKRWPHIQVASHLHAYVPELPWDYVRKSVSFNEYIDRYVVIKRSLQKVLTSTFCIPQDKVALIENGVDVEMYVPANEDEKQLIKQELGLPQDKKFISWIGRLSLDKDPLKFVTIARRLADLDPSDQVRCLIVGDGPLRTDVANEIDKHRLEEKILLLGNRNDISSLLKITDVAVSTSPNEGLPILGLEAMSAGIPTIAFHVPGWAELISPGIDGLLVPRFFLEEKLFAQCIKMVVDQPWLAEIMGQNARQKVTRYYPLNQFIFRFVQLYEQLSPSADRLDIE